MRVRAALVTGFLGRTLASPPIMALSAPRAKPPREAAPSANDFVGVAVGPPVQRVISEEFSIDWDGLREPNV